LLVLLAATRYQGVAGVTLKRGALAGVLDDNLHYVADRGGPVAIGDAGVKARLCAGVGRRPALRAASASLPLPWRVTAKAVTKFQAYLLVGTLPQRLHRR